MKTRLLLLFGVVLTLALLFAGGAQPSTAAVQPAAPTLPFGHPDAPPPESLPQAPITDTFKIYLPLVQRDFVYLIGPNVPFAYGWGVYEYWGYRPGWPGGHNTT
ncbi:MAG: YLP-box putative sorting motif-containing protein, partial [Anaerolineales bacterium]